MGLGYERYDSAFGAWVSDSGFSESNHRAFYRRWAELMDAASWRDLPDGKARHA
jgi:hypothetical protein